MDDALKAADADEKKVNAVASDANIVDETMMIRYQVDSLFRLLSKIGSRVSRRRNQFFLKWKKKGRGSSKSGL